MFLKIPSLYDSHTHWLGTGQIALGLQLFALSGPEDLSQIPLRPEYFRGSWLVGFGWNHHQWPDKALPTKEFLDQLYPKFPVMLTRIDGHCSWVNSQALELLGLECSHSGILLEEEHFKAYASLPAYSDQQVQNALIKATEIFNSAGFTHIRDMTCDEQQWNQARVLDQAGQLSLYVQENFLCDTPTQLPAVIALAKKARAEQTAHLNVQGIKIFFDGTLGSDTALLSKCACQKNSSFPWTVDHLEDLFRQVWQEGLEVAVHTIGDEAAHQVVLAARKVMSTNKSTGWLNLEHVEVLRPETVLIMKALHVRCHMQPCHWLSDRAWLKEKLGDLYKNAFPWGAISRAGIPLHFGSDSPVARASLWDNQQALRESIKAKIPALKGEMLEYHVFPNKPEKDTYCIFENQELKELFFDGRKII